MYPTAVPSPSFYEGYTFDFKWINLANPPQKSKLAQILQAGSKENTILKQQGYIHVGQYGLLLHETLLNLRGAR
jgi:hypothetical protein